MAEARRRRASGPSWEVRVLAGERSDAGEAQQPPLRVVVAGGGVGGLEALLALRHLAEDRVGLTLVCPDETFRYQAASVAVPFGRGEVRRFPVAAVAAAAGAGVVGAALERVDVEAGAVEIAGGERMAYDVLVVACGARRVPAVEGALTFLGEQSAGEIRALIRELETGSVRRVAFALPRGATWPLPLYELALLTAAHVAERAIPGVELVLVTSEAEPLAQFGGAVSRRVAELLDAAHVGAHLNAYPMRVVEAGLLVAPGATIPADRVVCMPEARGRPIPGLPHTPDGFLPIDADCAVVGTADVYAVGDGTTYPVKQGGIAAQQADHVAQIVARRAGAGVDAPGPLRPDLHGLLITGGEPLYLRAGRGGSGQRTAAVSTEPFVAPGGKIAARHLGHHLARADDA